MSKKKIKKRIPYIFIIAIQMLSSVILFGTLLVLVYSIPIEKIENNVRISAKQIAEEGVTPPLFTWCSSRLDNWTDSIMLLSAAYEDEDSSLKNAMQFEYRRIEGKDPYESLLLHYIDDVPFTYTYVYGRYWGVPNFLETPVVFDRL